MVQFFVVFLIGLENYSQSNNYFEILSNVETYPTLFIRYFPINILLFLFFQELLTPSSQNDIKLKFSSENENIVFIQDSRVWMALFETYYLEKIKTCELRQMIHLKKFSLEIDRNNKCVRVFIYSKSHSELLNMITESKPILEVLFPGINLISKADISNLFRENQLLKISKFNVLKADSKVIFPQNNSSTNSSDQSFSNMIIACNISDKKGNLQNDYSKNYIQCYYFNRYDHQSFFEGLSYFLHNIQIQESNIFWDFQGIQRARLRFQLKDQPLYDFKKGLDLFEKGLLGLFSTQKKENSSKEIKNYSSITFPQKKGQDFILKTDSENGKRNSIFSKIEQQNIVNKNINLKTYRNSVILKTNQICTELCDIPMNSKLIRKEKFRKCSRRSDFCKRLLLNDNFTLILDNIQNQKYDEEISDLIFELRRHLSYYQFICVLAQLTQSKNPKITFSKIIYIIQLLFRFKIIIQESETSEKSFSSLWFASNENDKEISLSLAPN
jgi:hypothetical protein